MADAGGVVVVVVSTVAVVSVAAAAVAVAVWGVHPIRCTAGRIR